MYSCKYQLHSRSGMYVTAIIALLGFFSIIQETFCSACSDLSEERLVSVPNCAILMWSKMDSREFVILNCSKLPDSKGAAFHLKVEILSPVTVAPKDQYSVCSGFFDLTAFRDMKDESDLEDYADDDDNDINHWYAGFNSTLATSVLVVKKDCWEKRINCASELKVKEDIYDSVLFNYQPHMKEFWNFKALLFRSSHKWFKKLHTTKYNYIFHSVKALANTSVEELIVTGNTDYVKDAFLGPMEDLKKLHIKDGTLDTFHEDNFKFIPNLEDLSLRGNNLNKIPRGISRLKKLRILDVSQSEGTFEITRDQLRALTTLEELNLADLKLGFVIDQLPMLQNLKLLNISNCEIDNIPKVPLPFHKFPSLQTLDLSNNNLITMDFTFGSNASIKILNVSSNSLTEISENVVANLTLDILDLSSNRFEVIPTLKFCLLQLLNLSSNDISNITNPGEDGMVVQRLDLSNNNIRHWDNESIFWNLNFLPNSSSTYNRDKLWLKSLDISRNYVSVYSKRMLCSLNGLAEVNLRENPLVCENCQMCHLKKWLSSKNNIKLMNVSEPLNCKKTSSSVFMSVSDISSKNCYQENTPGIESCDYEESHQCSEVYNSSAVTVVIGSFIPLIIIQITILY